MKLVSQSAGRLLAVISLKSRKPARKLRLTLKMKKKHLQFVLQHKDWTCAKWSKVLFSNESAVQQFATRKRNVCQPLGTQYNKKYTNKTAKHLPSVMVWGPISIIGPARLFFLKPGTMMKVKDI